MKKTVSKEVDFCDSCGKEGYTIKCLSCGAEHCWDCMKKLGKEYGHAVFSGGSRDGYFCNKCIKSPKKNKRLLDAYKNIEVLYGEYEQWWKNFNKREEIAEKHVEELRQYLRINL